MKAEEKKETEKNIKLNISERSRFLNHDNPLCSTNVKIERITINILYGFSIDLPKNDANPE